METGIRDWETAGNRRLSKCGCKQLLVVRICDVESKRCQALGRVRVQIQHCRSLPPDSPVSDISQVYDEIRGELALESETPLILPCGPAGIRIHPDGTRSRRNDRT